MFVWHIDKIIFFIFDNQKLCYGGAGVPWCLRRMWKSLRLIYNNSHPSPVTVRWFITEKECFKGHYHLNGNCSSHRTRTLLSYQQLGEQTAWKSLWSVPRRNQLQHNIRWWSSGVLDRACVPLRIETPLRNSTSSLWWQRFQCCALLRSLLPQPLLLPPLLSNEGFGLFAILAYSPCSPTSNVPRHAQISDSGMMPASGRTEVQRTSECTLLII